MTRQTTRGTLGNKTLSHKTRLMALLTTTALVSTTAVAQSLPTGGQVAAGSATIGTPSANALTINQTSGSAVVNWQSFNVGKGSRVTFVQPDANAAILNRVTGKTTSTIAGQINANGQVYLINPNGIAITKTGTVKAGGFVASTLGISDDDFMGGKRTFTGNGASKDVTNAGAITINRGGYMALIGGTVANSGVITVPMGKAALGSGEQATLDLSGDGFLQVAVPTKAGGKQALVDNSGRISANGGTVQLTAAAAKDMARQAVNMSGTIEAKGVSGKSGDIVLTGGDGEVAVTGKIDASNQRGTGGKVEVTGRKITLAGAKINASGKTGGGTINIGGNRQGNGPLKRAETLTVDANTVINADAVTTGNGGNVVLWSDDLTRFAGTITAEGGAVSGNGGEVEVSGKALLSYTGLADLTAAHGSFGNLLLDPYNITISTGTDTGGFTASADDSVINVSTLTTALSLANVTVTTGDSSSAGTQAGNITIAAPITWAAATTLSLTAANNIDIDAAITATSGGLTLNAGGTISATAAVSVGGIFNLASGSWVQNATTLPDFYAKDFQLNGGSFLRVTGGDGISATPYLLADIYGVQGIGSSAGYLAASWKLANDIDASGTASWNSGAGFSPIGPYSGFTGTFDGDNHVISHLSILVPPGYAGLFDTIGGSGTVKNLGITDATVISSTTAGILAGASNGTVTNVWTSGTVTGLDPVGGLVGVNSGTISGSWSSATVSGRANLGGLVGSNNGTLTQSYATGAVSGYYAVGGLVGYNGFRATITQSYATGTVSGSTNVGGLVGYNDEQAGIAQAYATGAVSGTTNVGGLLGFNEGTLTQSYATGAVSGSDEVGGLVGFNDSPAWITQSYATGAVSGASDVGGLVGHNIGGITQAYWDTQTSGLGVGVGFDEDVQPGRITGLTTRQLQGLAPVSGSLFSVVNALGNGTTSAFSGGENGLYPYLTSFFPNGMQVVSGFAYSDGGATPLASGAAGAVTIALNADGSRIGQATTGANGYYYIVMPIGAPTVSSGGYPVPAINNGQNLIAFTTGSAPAAATLTTASGSSVQTGVNLYGNALTVPTAATLFSQAPQNATEARAQNAAALATAAGNDAAATAAVDGSVGLGLFASGGSFTIDQMPAINGVLAIQTCACSPIIVNAPITVASGQGLGLLSEGVLTINAPINVNGAGSVALAYDASSPANLSFGLTGTGFTSSVTYLDGNGQPITSDAGGKLSINSNAYALVYTMAQLDAIDGMEAVGNASVAIYGPGLSGNYALARGLDASGVTYTDAIVAGQNGTQQFSGTLEGLGHTVANLTISAGGNNYVGLIGKSTGTVRDIGVAGGSVSGNDYVGGLVGINYITGTVAQSYATGAVSGSDYIGGLVGINYGGTVTQSYATGAVSGSVLVGGLVGANEYGTITQSYATGAVSGSSGVGGLAGGNYGTITQAYATGAVSGSFTVGGLVGANDTGTITQAYATGAVSGSANVGGLVGYSQGVITQAYWDTQTSGLGAGIGNIDTSLPGTVTGLTTAQMNNPTNFINAGWDYSSVWGTLKTGGAPVLRALTSDPLISYYVTLSGDTSTTFGDGITSTSGITVGGAGASYVTVGWGSAIGATTNAGTYAYGATGVLALTYAVGNASDYYVDYGTGALTVNQRIVNLSGSQTYNGTTNVASGNLTLSNLANGETLTLSGLGQLASKNVGSNLVFSLGTLALGNGSGLASNYMLAGGTDTITISKALISSIGGIVAGNKTYDGSTAVTLDASGVVFNGMAQGDALTLGAGFSGLFSDANAGSNKTVTVSGLSLTGADAGNYTLASNTTTTLANIAQRIVNLSGSRVYDGTTALDHSMLRLSNLVGNETLTLSGAGSMGDKNAGNGKAVALSSLLLGDGTNGGLASNYTLVGGSNTVDIAKATISTISGITANGKTYDGSTNATLNTNGATFNGMVAGDALTVGAGFSGLFSDANAGSSKAVTISGLSLTGADAGNYTLASNTASTLANIAQRMINLSGNRVYDGTTALDHSMLTLSNLVGNETLTLSGTASMGDKNAGNGKSVNLGSLALGDSIHGDGGVASNYVLGSGTVDIAKAVINSIGGIVAGSKTYDGSANAALDSSGVTFTGKIGGDVLALGTGFTGLFSDTNAGSNKTVTISGLNLAGADAGNYTLANTTATTLANIAQRVISLSGNRIYDGTTALDHSIFALSNLVSGETLSLSGTGSIGDKNAGNGKSVSLGSLALGDGTGLASNYVLGTGTVDIAKATITSIGGITASGKTYDGSTNAALNSNGASFTGMVAGDVLTLGNGYAGAFADANAGSNKTVTVSGLSLAGADVGNYTLANTTATTLANIAQRVVSLSGSRTYNGSTDVAASIFTLSNLVGNERLTLSGAGSMGDKNAGNGKSVALSSLLLGDGTNGGLASNYTLAGGTYTVDIAKAAISAIGGITANGKTYDGSTNVTLSTAGAVFNGMAIGDVLTLGNGIAAQFSDANAGLNKTVKISGLSLSGPDAGNYTLANTTATTLANIAQRVISLSGNRIYDGTTSFDHSFLTLSNLIGNEMLTLSGSGSIADKSTGIGKSLSLGSLLLGNGTNGGLASNYTLVGGSNTVGIGKATISAISGITANGRIYDGTTNATLNSNGATFTGMIAGDVLTLGNGLTGTFSDKNAGTGKLISISGLSLSGADAGNYTLASTTATTFADIAKASLTLSGFAVSNKTYDGSVSAGISNAGTLGGIVANDIVSFGYGGATFSDKNAGSDKVVTLSRITLSGMDADNYTIASTATTTADIARATISSIGGITASSKTYDGSATATLDTGNATFTGLVTGDSLSLGSGSSGAFADANAGSGKVVTIAGLSLAGADAGNYTLANTTATTLANVGQRTISLSGSRSYDGTTALDHSILTLSNLVGNETLSLSGTGSMGDKNAGNGKSVSLGSLSLDDGTGLASNYVLGSGTVDIAKAVITSISGITASGKTYDGSTNVTLSAAGGVSFNGIVAGDVLALGSGYAGAFADTNTGSSKTVTISGLSLAGADAGNYTLANTTASTLATIGQRVINLSGSRIYDGTTVLDHSIFALSNLVGTETLTLSGIGSMGDKNAGNGKSVNLGSLALGNGTGLASNYVLGSGTVDIAKAVITSIGGITANGKTYDGSTNVTLSTAGAVFNGMAAGDVLTLANGYAGDLADTNAGVGKVVTISGLSLAGADAGNYTLANTSATALADIARRVITVTANGASRTYGDANPVFTYTVGGAGFVNGDVLSGGLASAATAAAGVGTYGITLGTLGNANYDISYSGADLTVNRRAITVTANGATRTYGDANPVFTYTVGDAGLVNNDSLSGSLSTLADGTSNVGTYGITQGTLGNANYDISYSGADLTVTKRAITVAANNVSRAYGDANPLLTYTVGGAGLVHGDLLSGNLATSANGASNVGIYGIGQGSLAASGNYDLAFSGADLTVTRRAITVVANNQSRIYGDANPLLTYTIGGDGLVNGDLLSGNLATSANGASNVGIYGIGQGWLAASGNYDLTFTAGNLAVTPRAITVSVNGASRSYGDQNPLLSYVATGLINGDSLTGALSTAANAASNVGSYAIGLGTLGNGNYTIGYTGANLTITPRLIDVIASNASRFTGAANPLFAYTIGGAGLVNGDRLFGELVSAANPFSAPGNYVITRGSLTSSANYAMRFNDGMLTVNAAPSTPSGELASVIIPRSYQPDTTPPLPPAQSESGPAFAGEGHDDGSRTLISDRRFDGTVVCLGNGEACVVPRSAP